MAEDDAESLVIRIKSKDEVSTESKVKIHLMNFRERLVLEHNIVSHIKIECMFVFFIVFYVLSIYNFHSWPPADKLSIPLSSALIDEYGYSKHLDFNAAVELLKEQGEYLANFNAYREPFYFKNTTDAYPTKEFVEPAFLVLPTLLIRRQSLTADCPNFSGDLQSVLPKFGFCTKLGESDCSVNAASFNLLNCLDPAVDPPAPALRRAVLGTSTVEAALDFFGALPWGKEFKQFDGIVAATPSQIAAAAQSILGNVTLQAEISGIQLRLMLVFPAEVDVVELFFLEFQQKINGGIAVRYYQEAIVNPESTDWFVVIALIGAVLDAIIQLRQLSSFSGQARGKDEREDDEINLEDDDEDAEPRLVLENETFSAWNLIYDIFLICIATFKMYYMRINWVSDRAQALMKLQGDTANPQTFLTAYDDFLQLLDWGWLLKKLEGVLLLLLVWRCIKLPSGHPRIASLVRTLSIAWDELGHFLFLFIVVQIILAVASLIAFGDSYIGVSSLTRLLLVQYGIIGSQFPEKDELHRIGKSRSAELTFLLALNGVVSFFMMATFFLAIIVKAYADAEAELQRYVVVQQFPSDVFSIAKTWLRGLRYGYSDKLRVIRAIELIIYRKRLLKQSGRNPRLSNIPTNDFGGYTDFDEPPSIPVLDTSNITNANAKKDPPMTASAQELRSILNEDPSDMLKYYLYQFGGLDWYKGDTNPASVKMPKGKYPFLHPEFPGLDPEPALTLLQFTAKLEKALQNTLFPQMKRLAFARREFETDMKNYEIASAEKQRGEQDVKYLKDTYVASTGLQYQAAADTRRRRVVSQIDEVTPFARVTAMIHENNIQTKMLIEKIKKPESN